jgi:transmembrane sensor
MKNRGKNNRRIMIDKERCREILIKYLDGTIDPVEYDELFIMSADENVEALLGEMIETDFNADQPAQAGMPLEVSKDILKRILSSEENTNRLFTLSKRNKLVRQFSIAAVFLVVVAGVAFFYFKPVRENAPLAFEALIPKNSIKKINTTSASQLIELEDGSTVKLAPHASLSFPLHFTKGRREVFMTGEAFFVVTKNPASPFFVYYNNIVTRVLGTSFNIKTNLQTKNVEVSVMSGKVQVIENRNLAAAVPSRKDIKSVIVTANQKALYDEKSHDFETTLSDSISPLPGNPGLLKYSKSMTGVDSFYFPKAANLKQVFSQLENVYGVEIIVDNENIYNCVFTGDISKLDMWKKLSIVCITVGATYEVKGTKILVSGRGCN